MILAILAAGCVLVPLFLCRAIPPATNTSRDVDAYQRRRSMGDQPFIPENFVSHEADYAR